MSAPRLFGLSDAARRDFANIMGYTVREWGAAQAERYRARIDKTLNLIAANPGLGHTANDISENFRVFSVGSHSIIYVVGVETIIVARILHQRMNRADHL
jgi:toxin ParE1/3/4